MAEQWTSCDGGAGLLGKRTFMLLKSRSPTEAASLDTAHRTPHTAHRSAA